MSALISFFSYFIQTSRYLISFALMSDIYANMQCARIGSDTVIFLDTLGLVIFTDANFSAAEHCLRV